MFSNRVLLDLRTWGHSIGLPLHPLSMYQWCFCVKLASVDSRKAAKQPIDKSLFIAFYSCYFSTVRFFEKESRDIQKESYGISGILIRSGLPLLIQSLCLAHRTIVSSERKGGAVARTAFTGQVPSTGRGVESTISELTSILITFLFSFSY